MTSRQFWDTWLLVVGGIVVIFGLLLAFTNQSWLFEVVFTRQVNAVFFSSGQTLSDTKPFQAWIYGVLGMTVSGWGVFVLFVARYPFRRRERWAWNCIFAGVTLWFVPDTSLSLLHGVFVNVALNVVLATLIYVPLVATRRQFASGPAPQEKASTK